MYSLGIETSCDETSCAVVSGQRVRSVVTVSSLNYHKRYGGVIPEIATRNHLQFIDSVCCQALKKARVRLHDISVIAATYRPGLRGALVIGVNFAKALSVSCKIPFLGVNHLHAHLFSPFLDYPKKIPLPCIGLVVSGGHTDIFLVKDFDDITLLGETRDDACGEVYDKIARSFGLGYPGGGYIDALYQAQWADSYRFRCPRIGLGFSFSGIKTAVIYKKMELEKAHRLTRDETIKILSSFQESVVTTLVENVFAAAAAHKIKTIICGGGVTANLRLRSCLNEKAKETGTRLYVPQKRYTADNAAMVAGLAFYLYNDKKNTSSLDLEVETN
ncbi:MAG: tRNA (adenosine(37)-N6)-threonylcarbamoyltransferase complex transferase subunit TsaD [Candidatus Omnitrophica bacterium]|nr:tRNA (adenosine(37)-N6)-threonylcarbamoyltransferase complex transferase subunit TsaD [Candidatus Omnitrophota bacterium]